MQRARDVSEPPPFSLRSIAVPAFGPSLLFAIGEGAILPVSRSASAIAAARWRWPRSSSR